MGSARWDPKDWQTHSVKTSTMTQKQIFTQNGIHSDLDPKLIAVRESVDSDQNPNSTPVIIAVDETCSMGVLAETIIKKGLGVIMEGIYDRRPIPDPHVLCMAVGDSICDRAPLQATQFEADIRLADQVKNFFIEANGGGNGGESYPLVWYFAAMKTKCDAMIKRGRKGYLFTIGDEPPHMRLSREEIGRVFGDNVETDFAAEDLLAVVSQHWEVFHLIVRPGSYSKARWVELLGERAIDVSDHEKLAEVIVSTMQVIEGHDPKAVIDSWSGDTSVVVASAIHSLTKSSSAGTGVVRL
jgi:hypothetical protein